MTYHTTDSHKLIIAILPKGQDKELVHRLVKEMGVNSVNVNYARGIFHNVANSIVKVI